MAGKGGYRANAGRPSMIDEELRARVITKSWDIIGKFFDNEKETDRDKIDVAKYLAGKSVPQNLNIAGELTHNVFLQNMIAKSKAVK